jgi:glycosyltransferase involved in cell wall biosynthesis
MMKQMSHRVHGRQEPPYSDYPKTKPDSSLKKGAQNGNQAPDLICFSHLRWDFVYQRPQHLLSRAAEERRVFFVEEPIFSDTFPHLEITSRESNLWVVVPCLPVGLAKEGIDSLQQSLIIDELIIAHNLTNYVFWYYTPMALSFSEYLEPLAVVYDCMDELSAFRNAPTDLIAWEQQLFKRADLVFTGGVTLYESKRQFHPNVYPFPSSIDGTHFRQARKLKSDPPDQAGISHPRIGYYGVIDERIDLAMIDQLAESRPDWSVVMIGPVVKIDPVELPRRANIHYLGQKSYESLPEYLCGWDVAMMPFARNESTRFISPTKTPEYLAGGIPVVSTSISDVVRQYGRPGLVRIADSADAFAREAEFLMSRRFDRKVWLRRVDEALSYESWDRTWARMAQLLNSVLSSRYPEVAVRDSALQVRTQAAGAELIATQTGD